MTLTIDVYQLRWHHRDTSIFCHVGICHFHLGQRIVFALGKLHEIIRETFRKHDLSAAYFTRLPINGDNSFGVVATGGCAYLVERVQRKVIACHGDSFTTLEYFHRLFVKL